MPEPEFDQIVDKESTGLRLDQYLAQPLGSRARAARLIGAGLVTVDGRGAQKRRSVTGGQRVVVLPEPEPDWAAAQSTDSGPSALFTIVYEVEHLLVVDKPTGVVVHPARGHQTGTLAQALADRAAGGDDPYRAGIVHRLDRDTSGLLVIAKSEQAHRELKALLQARELRREYLALVDGVPPAHSGTIDAAIGRDRSDRVLHSVDSATPREARTHFDAVETFQHATLLRVVLDTGRTHQIRVHMKAIGHPVTGDRAYGGTMRYGLARQFLHAARLAFTDPISGESVDVSSPLPEDLDAALTLARAELD
jgi:23S rRNA pseudouridine1911/1915/1917 synthase